MAWVPLDFCQTAATKYRPFAGEQNGMEQDRIG